MKKILIVLAHPNFQISRINKALINVCSNQSHITINNLYDKYPKILDINIEKEQELLIKHDKIVLQFPLYWYSSPAILKQWLDSVLTYGWAYGNNVKALQNKELFVAVTTGGVIDSYQAGGANNYSLSEILKPFQQVANFLGMKYLPSFKIGNALHISDEELNNEAQRYLEYINLDN